MNFKRLAKFTASMTAISLVSLSTAAATSAAHERAFNQACALTSNKYFISLDRDDHKRYASLFTEDGMLQTPAGVFNGPKEIAAYIEKRSGDIIMRHNQTSILVDQIDGNTAKGVVYALINFLMPAEQGVGQAIPDGYKGELSRGFVIGIYNDEYVLEGGVCKFKKRIYSHGIMNRTQDL